MPDPLSFGVEVVGVGPVDVPHDLRQVGERRFEQEMVMIGHQAPGMNDGAVTGDGRFEITEELFAVCFAFEDVFLFVAPTGDVVMSAGDSILNGRPIKKPSSDGCYKIQPTKEGPFVKCVDLTPLPLPSFVKCVDLTP